MTLCRLTPCIAVLAIIVPIGCAAQTPWGAAPSAMTYNVLYDGADDTAGRARKKRVDRLGTGALGAR